LFPQGTSYAFWGSEEDPMTVQVVLNLYIPLDHPLHMICAKKARNLSDHPELIAAPRRLSNG